MHCFPDILTSALCTYIIQNMSGSVQSCADIQLALSGVKLALSGVKLAEVGIVLELEIPCALVAFPVCPGTHSVKGRTPSSLPARPVGTLASVGIVRATLASV